MVANVVTNMTMTVQILYFAGLADKLRTSNESLEIPSSFTLGQLKEKLSTRGEDWAANINAKTTRSALNQNLSNDDATLNNGDEIAFFPPVTGG